MRLVHKAAFFLAMGVVFTPSLGLAQALPDAPKLPSRLSFTEELAGRRALYALRDKALQPEGFSYQCRWKQARLDTRGRVSSIEGTETLYAAAKNKLAITYEYGEAGRRLVRRALSDGESFLAVRFDERGKQTTREYSRFSLDEAGGLDRALVYARLEGLGQTRAVPLAVAPTFPLLTRVWKGSDGAILEVDSLPARAGRPVRISRYTLDSATKNLKRFEQWETREGRTTYRSEDYGAAPKAADPFSQALPDTYQEKPIALPRRPVEPPIPDDADPKALALFAQWTRAHERYYTLHATAQVVTELQKRAPDSPDPRRGGYGGGAYNGTYDLWLWRPGRVLGEATSQGALPVPQTWKSDGVTLTMKEQQGTPRTQPLREGEVIERALFQIARRNSLDPLQWFLLGPPRLSDFQKIVARGPVVLPGGERTELVELSRTDESRQRNDRAVTTETLCRVWLGSDGIPRGFETIRKTSIASSFERDQPPTSTTTVRLSKVFVDREPPF